jgi:hypothetical protein
VAALCVIRHDTQEIMRLILKYLPSCHDKIASLSLMKNLPMKIKGKK